MAQPTRRVSPLHDLLQLLALWPRPVQDRFSSLNSGYRTGDKTRDILTSFFLRFAHFGSKFTPAVHYTFTTHVDAHHLSSSTPNGEQYLSRYVVNLTSALVQHTILVNQLLEHINRVSKSRTRTYDHDFFHQHLGKQPLNPP